MRTFVPVGLRGAPLKLALFSPVFLSWALVCLLLMVDIRLGWCQETDEDSPSSSEESDDGGAEAESAQQETDTGGDSDVSPDSKAPGAEAMVEPAVPASSEPSGEQSGGGEVGAPVEKRTVPAVTQNKDSRAIATDTAQAAAQVHAEHCAQVWGKNDALAAGSMVAVSQQWARVVEVYEQSKASYLLYWRAMLTECLGQDERAMIDFQAFIEHEDSRYSPSMVADAEWRLRRVFRKASGQVVSGASTAPAQAGLFARRPAAAAAIGIGAGLLLVSAAPTAFSIGAWQSVVRLNERMHQQLPPEDGWGKEMQEMTEDLQASRASLGVAIGMAVGGLTSVVVGAAVSRGRPVRVSGGLTPRGLSGIEAGLALQW